MTIVVQFLACTKAHGTSHRRIYMTYTEGHVAPCRLANQFPAFVKVIEDLRHTCSRPVLDLAKKSRPLFRS